MKLRKLHIEDYKMFKDFDIDFLDENDEALDIVVLAGVNGSGKTTLLEFIKEFFNTLYDDTYGKFIMEIIDNQQIIKYDNYEIETILNKFNRLEGKEVNYVDSLIYFSTDTSIENVEELMPEYLRKMVWDEDIKASEAFTRVRNYANDVFKDIDIQIEFDSRDGEKNLYFRNKSGGDKFLIRELSTGEKTLVSKVLYMYLAAIKDKVILIDEPELSLHPKWQNKVLKIYENFAKQNNCQIIIATHSPHIIGSAKPESIRLLKKEDNTIKVVDNFSRSYGLEFDKVLTEIMGVENLRTPPVARDIRRLWELLRDEEYESSQYQELYKSLETLLGDLDEDLVLARLEVAKLKSQNAKAQ